ncbi:hypothetical protein CJ030_MR7G013506 [Morella rubra]|uniref:HMA domain-containing protein n=1 Tax=Morella rubra TaxID=262757 RepID=A0A6A1V4H5_9ROSI|nr:hypothetical protein CJ030_MR7G013506 [Morella rubra]
MQKRRRLFLLPRILLNMMKQKMVIKVQVNCEECRIKALRLAAKPGVTSLAIEGSDKDELVVIDEGIDSVNLTRSLRKKLRHAKILKVEEVKVEEVKEEDQGNQTDLLPQHPICLGPRFCEVFYDENPNYCSIL